MKKLSRFNRLTSANGPLIAGGICTVISSCGDSNIQQNESRLNIVFLLADDLRWNSLRCAGNDLVLTPSIDKLAQNGIRFTNAHVTTAISMVSRASILTGQYMSRHGIREFGVALNEEAFRNTYVSVLRNSGYWTGFVGKYGVGKIRPGDFDFSREYEGRHWFPAENGDSVHVTVRNTNDALDFLRQRPEDKPFLLSVSFFATHAQDNHPDQYRYQPESENLYKDVQIPVPETAADEYFYSLPPFLASEANEGRIRWHWRFDTPEKYQKYMKAYYRMLTELDAAIGKIIAELERQNELENTMIIFMGDNGYFHAEHGLADKWYPYEESIRVPLVVYDPRLPEKERGALRDEFVLNIDVAPSIIASAGSDIPQSIQGQDFTSLYLNKRNPGWREDFYYEHPFVTSETRIPSSEALVTSTSKYIWWPYYKFEEYFDLETDPLEKSNRINDPEAGKVINDLKMRFEELKLQAK